MMAPRTVAPPTSVESGDNAPAPRPPRISRDSEPMGLQEKGPFPVCIFRRPPKPSIMAQDHSLCLLIVARPKEARAWTDGRAQTPVPIRAQVSARTWRAGTLAMPDIVMVHRRSSAAVFL